MLFIDLLPKIQPYVPGAPIALIIEALRTSATNYCRKSNAFRYSPDPIPALEGISLYDVVVLDDTRIAKVITAKYKNSALSATSGTLRNRAAIQTIPTTYQLMGDEIMIDGAPTVTEEDALTFEFSLEPTLLATSIDDIFISEHYQGVINGAIAYLLSIPGKEWSSPTYNLYEAKAMEAIVEARVRANGDNTPKVRVTSYGGL